MVNVFAFNGQQFNASQFRQEVMIDNPDIARVSGFLDRLFSADKPLTAYFVEYGEPFQGRNLHVLDFSHFLLASELCLCVCFAVQITVFRLPVFIMVDIALPSARPFFCKCSLLFAAY